MYFCILSLRITSATQERGGRGGGGGGRRGGKREGEGGGEKEKKREKGEGKKRENVKEKKETNRRWRRRKERRSSSSSQSLHGWIEDLSEEECLCNQSSQLYHALSPPPSQAKPSQAKLSLDFIQAIRTRTRHL